MKVSGSACFTEACLDSNIVLKAQKSKIQTHSDLTSLFSSLSFLCIINLLALQ